MNDTEDNPTDFDEVEWVDRLEHLHGASHEWDNLVVPNAEKPQ